MDTPNLSQDSSAWIFFVHLAFGVSLFLMCIGIYYLPEPAWIRGYLAMGLFFTVSSTITLSKTIRDNHEAKKIVNRLSEAKTEKILKDYDFKP